MKLSLTYLISTALAVTVQADLTTKWNFAYDATTRADNIYTFSYTGISNSLTNSNLVTKVFAGDSCEGTVFAKSGKPATTTDESIPPTLSTEFTGISLIYEAGNVDNTGTMVVDVTMSSVDAANNGDITQNDVLKFCARTSLTTDLGLEVNYLETVVTLTISMEGGFSVAAFDVTEKEKSTTAETQAYTVEAALCSTGPFNQGSLICVLVTAPSNEVEVTDITSFDWTNGAAQGLVTQKALPNADGLTETVASNSFQTILKAGFYDSGIAVTGSGVATLAFVAGRRLNGGNNDKIGRSLQDDVITDFAIVADIVKSDDGPTALQTAGGATASFVVTIAGLVGAILLA